MKDYDTQPTYFQALILSAASVLGAKFSPGEYRGGHRAGRSTSATGDQSDPRLVIPHFPMGFADKMSRRAYEIGCEQRDEPLLTLSTKLYIQIESRVFWSLRLAHTDSFNEDS